MTRPIHITQDPATEPPGDARLELQAQREGREWWVGLPVSEPAPGLLESVTRSDPGCLRLRGRWVVGLGEDAERSAWSEALTLCRSPEPDPPIVPVPEPGGVGLVVGVVLLCLLGSG